MMSFLGLTNSAELNRATTARQWDEGGSTAMKLGRTGGGIREEGEEGRWEIAEWQKQEKQEEG